MIYDLPNPFMQVSATAFRGSLPSGESDPAVMLDCAVADREAAALEPDEPAHGGGGAAAEPVGYQCCVDCGAREPCDEHCPWSGKPVPTSPEPTARFQLDEVAMLSEIEPVPAFLTRPVECKYQAEVDKLNRSTDADIARAEIEELLQLARAEDWPAPPRRMVG